MNAHYILATWGGPRRDDWPAQVADPTYFVAVHLAQIARLKTSRIQKITVAAPTFPLEPASYQLRLEALALRHEIETGISVEILRRKNIGISYGSFSDAWLANRGRFEATIFCEDDQLPGVDDFDSLLLEKLRNKAIGYSAALVIKRGLCPVSAGIPFGAAREGALEELAHTWGGEDDFALPHWRSASAEDYRLHEMEGQVPFTSFYPKMGLKLADMVEDGFPVLFRARQWFERFDPRVRTGKPLFCLPVESVGRNELLPMAVWRRMRAPFAHTIRRREGFSEDMERRLPKT